MRICSRCRNEFPDADLVPELRRYPKAVREAMAVMPQKCRPCHAARTEQQLRAAGLVLKGEDRGEKGELPALPVWGIPGVTPVRRKRW